MGLSRRTLSAVAAVLDLARLARGKPLAAKLLASGRNLPPRQFETVLQDLVRAGILKGLRGPRGGYELARERRRITLGDIVRAMEAAGETGGPTAVETTVDRALAPVLAEAQAAFLARLDAVTVEALLGQSEGRAPAATATSDYTI